jgi:hypothetical protein
MSQKQADSDLADGRSGPLRDWVPLRRRSFAGIGLCLLLVVLAGCLGGGPSLRQLTDTTGTTTQDCITPDHVGDPYNPSCLIEERPPDLDYENLDNRTHNLSIEVTRFGTPVVGTNITVHPNATGTSKDIIDAPGTYRITVTVDGNLSQTETVTFDRRWLGRGGSEWQLRIFRDGSIDFRRYPRQ